MMKTHDETTGPKASAADGSGVHGALEVLRRAGNRAWDLTRQGPAGVVLRRLVWPYRAMSEINGREVAALWCVTVAGWVLGAVVTSGLPVVVHVLAGFVFGVVGIAVCAGATWWWTTYRGSPAQDRHTLLARAGFAQAGAINRELGEEVALRRGPIVRPTLAQRAAAERRELRADEVAWRVGSARGQWVWVMSEHAMYLVGPPRSGKGFGLLIAMIVEGIGAVVSTSTRGDNMEATIAARSKKGPVYVFDPERVTGRETTLRWSPIRGCEDPVIAQRRASTLVARTGLAEGENAVWAASAGGIIQCLLHAAAIGGRSIHDLHRWSTSPTAAREAVRILEERSSENWGLTIAAILGDDGRMRSNKWFGVEGAFKGLDVESIRNMFDTPVDDPGVFDPEAFLRESGTLYLISRRRDGGESAVGVGGFFSLILDDIAEATRRLSQAPEASGRLDPPVTFVLDEIANIHAWPSLPRAMSAGGGEGLQVVVAFQSRSQARDAYGKEVEATMWESGFKVLLGGSASGEDLRELSGLLGERETRHINSTWQGVSMGSNTEQRTQVPLITPDELRRLPEGVALLLAGRSRPVLVDLQAWPERPWAEQVRASQAWHKTHPAFPGGVAPAYCRPSRPEQAA